MFPLLALLLGAAGCKQELRLQQAEAFRTEHIERLKGILLEGSVAQLLGGRSEADEDEPVSAKQMQRLTTQGWALVHVYKEMGRLEAAVASKTERPPRDGILVAACASAAAEFGLHADTVRNWQLEDVYMAS